ncbi:hypothetical protein BpHYR1_045929, partial [Brachionus plicatilis]
MNPEGGIGRVCCGATSFITIFRVKYNKKQRISEWPAKPYPVYHWPIFDSKLDEVAGDAQFTSFNDISFTTDRFGNSNSAARINNGVMHLP